MYLIPGFVFSMEARKIESKKVLILFLPFLFLLF